MKVHNWGRLKQDILVSQTCWGLLRTPRLYPNCVLDPMTAATAVVTRGKVSLGRGGLVRSKMSN